ncbi:hypothetical protein AS006_02325 [Thermotoga sp. SG1]|nr:hypothetical protein AS006_02325 [Thermotoga sp. SG1]
MHVKKISYGGIISALVIFLLYTGNFTKSKIFFAALCSVFTGFLVELFGKGAIALIVALNLLSFLIIPNPGYVLIFLVLSFYSLVRKKSFLLRFFYLNASFFLLLIVAIKFFKIELPEVSSILYIFGVAGLQLAFLAYDYLYTRILDYLLHLTRERK